ncbi:putative nuclease HARBI1 [Saccostrea cucullata]|uniref:putative nuclease HARBI1 n=1 Tax=Saccostrea cuccullata TaxID=36930 RepID=UPI002ED69898
MASALFLRRALRREGVFRDRGQPLDMLDDVDLISRYRFPRRVLLELIDGVDAHLGPVTNRSHSIPTQLQVLCTLRYLAKGDFFSEVGDIHGISKSSLSVFLPRVCRALNLFLDNIIFPSNAQILIRMKEEFYGIARFPNVVGAIDGTLIPIRGMSGEDEPIFVCRKNSPALNIQGVVNAKMRYIYFYRGLKAVSTDKKTVFSNYIHGHIRISI